LRVSVAKKTTAERTDERLRRAEAEKHESSAKRNVLRTHTTGERPYEPKSKICISDAQHPAAQGGCLKVTPDRPRIEDVTREVVFRTVRDERVVTFPSSPVHVQPRGWTLVNLETNVYAEQRYVDRTVTVLTWPVEVRANPASYTWSFGDGDQVTTSSLGAPYPDGDVTHEYRERGKVTISVTLNYDTWYRVPGGQWTSAGIVSIPGPGTSELVCEARPVLTDPDKPESADDGGANGNTCAG